MKYAKINPNDIANGAGVRVSLFVSGCTHHCKGCFNEIAWDFNYGEDFTEDTIEELMKLCKRYYIAGLSILGGEPMELINQKGLLPLFKEFHKRYPNKNIWLYTGYTYESDILSKTGKVHCDITDELMSHITYLVDGEFIEDMKDITLRFRGSRNQRIIKFLGTVGVGCGYEIIEAYNH